MIFRGGPIEASDTISFDFCDFGSHFRPGIPSRREGIEDKTREAGAGAPWRRPFFDRKRRMR